MNGLPYEQLNARELLAAVDRSDPQVRALADHLERHLNALDALAARYHKRVTVAQPNVIV